jgi:hypothetical protein
MAAAQHKLSRRALLAGACSAAAVPLPRHSGLDPEPMNTAATPVVTAVFMGPGFRRDDEKWEKASALYARAVAGLEAVAHTEDDDLYDRALGRHNAALVRLLRAPAPDLASVARKLDLILRHTVFELTLGESCLAALQRDVRRFADQPFPLSSGPA